MGIIAKLVEDTEAKPAKRGLYKKQNEGEGLNGMIEIQNIAEEADLGDSDSVKSA